MTTPTKKKKKDSSQKWKYSCWVSWRGQLWQFSNRRLSQWYKKLWTKENNVFFFTFSCDKYGNLNANVMPCWFLNLNTLKHYLLKRLLKVYITAEVREENTLVTKPLKLNSFNFCCVAPLSVVVFLFLLRSLFNLQIVWHLPSTVNAAFLSLVVAGCWRLTNESPGKNHPCYQKFMFTLCCFLNVYPSASWITGDSRVAGSGSGLRSEGSRRQGWP